MLGGQVLLTPHTKSTTLAALSLTLSLLMKRKAISQLLHDGDPAAVLDKLIPSTERQAATARRILTAALSQSRRDGLSDPVAFYTQVCESSAAALKQYLAGTPEGELSLGTITRCRALLKAALTSRAGRPKESPLPRKEQLATAQQRRRDKQRNEEGRKLLQVFISESAMAYIIAIQDTHAYASRDEAVEKVLQAAILGHVLSRDAN